MDKKVENSKFYNLVKDLSDKKLDLVFKSINSPEVLECIKCYLRSVQHETQDKAMMIVKKQRIKN